MPHTDKTHSKDWERGFFERFGADKVWVNPSKENVETILEIWEYIRSVEKQTEMKAKTVGRDIYIEEVDWSEWGITEEEAGDNFTEEFNRRINL